MTAYTNGLEDAHTLAPYFMDSSLPMLEKNDRKKCKLPLFEAG